MSIRSSRRAYVLMVFGLFYCKSELFILRPNRALVFDAQATKTWIADRVLEAKENSRRNVTLPLVWDSQVYLCPCPEYYIGIFHAFTGKPLNWISITPQSRFHLKREKRIYLAQGYFTGKENVLTFEGGRFITPEFHVNQAEIIANTSTERIKSEKELLSEIKKGASRTLVLGSANADDERIYNRHSGIFNYFNTLDEDLHFFVENSAILQKPAPLIFTASVVFTGKTYEFAIYSSDEGTVYSKAHGIEIKTIEIPKILSAEVNL